MSSFIHSFFHFSFIHSFISIYSVIQLVINICLLDGVSFYKFCFLCNLPNWRSRFPTFADTRTSQTHSPHPSRAAGVPRDAVRECLETDPANRTDEDVEILLEFTQHLRAFSNMTLSVRRALCSVMVSGRGVGEYSRGRGRD